METKRRMAAIAEEEVLKYVNGERYLMALPGVTPSQGKKNMGMRRYGKPSV